MMFGFAFFLHNFATQKTETMSIERNEKAEPKWYKWDYALRARQDVFSPELWGHTVEWDVLLEHIRRVRGLCHLMSEATYPSSLFASYVDLLEANIYTFGDLFYQLTGLKTNTCDFKLFNEALTHIHFWNMDHYQEIRQTEEELHEVLTLFIEGLKQEPLWEELKQSPIWSADASLLNYKSLLESPISWTDEKHLARHSAYSYVRDIYKTKDLDKQSLAEQIANIIVLIHFHHIILGACGHALRYDFLNLLSSFRKSERARTRHINYWTRYFDGTRDDLINRMRNNPDLGPWVDRYDCLDTNQDVMGLLFCEEYCSGVFYPLKEDREEEYYNTQNWLNILTVAAVLQEYDERHSAKAEEEKPRKSGRAESPFIKFIVDPSQSEGILKRLHELIDTKPPKICAQTIFAAQQKGWITLPSHAALFKEFPEIGDKGNYKYHKERRDYYKDDIDAIEKSL